MGSGANGEQVKMSFARIRSLVIVSLLAVCALAVVWVVLNKDSQTRTAQAESCPAGSVQVNLAFPEPKNVKVHVYNASGQNGLGGQVTDDLGNRKFAVDPKPGTLTKPYNGVVRFQYGPKAAAAAWLLRAYFLDQVEFLGQDNKTFVGFDPKRKDDVVDVIVGTQYKQLGTPTEVNQAIAQLGNPQLPPGTCAAKTKAKA